MIATRKKLLTLALWVAAACISIEAPARAGGFGHGPSWKQAKKITKQAATDVQNGGKAIAHAANEVQSTILTGPALEQWLKTSRDTAAHGAMPIPDDIRHVLAGYASEDSMNRVRYKVGDNGFVNLAHVAEHGGSAAAVTLIDVVVFRGPSEAKDPSIWAHELFHVDQYRDWGVHDFAVRYMRDWHTVENPAYAKGDGYAAWRESHP